MVPSSMSQSLCYLSEYGPWYHLVCHVAWDRLSLDFRRAFSKPNHLAWDNLLNLVRTKRGISISSGSVDIIGLQAIGQVF